MNINKSTVETIKNALIFTNSFENVDTRAYIMAAYIEGKSPQLPTDPAVAAIVKAQSGSPTSYVWRAKELLAQGLSYNKAAQQLNKEGFKNSRNKPLNEGTVYSAVNAH